MRILYIILFISLCNVTATAQIHKMSPYVYNALSQYRLTKSIRRTAGMGKTDNQCITALVKCSSEEDITSKSGCKVLASFDDIRIASIPLRSLSSLAADPSVLRIEANESCSLCVDTARMVTNTNYLWNYDESGNIVHDASLQKAYTGKGVLIGFQDIGFDLTHPNFYRNRGTGELIVKRMWDFLDPDTVGSALPVGREYVTEPDLIAKAHATDGYTQTHGTETAGVAVGSGYDTPYVGVAPNADLCLVANAVTSDSIYVSKKDWAKFTTALDLLGFKYIFNYADSVGKPCVINFSEGSRPDFYNYILYDEVLQKLTGPGKIIVTTAGNDANILTYLDKPAGKNETHSLYRNKNGKTASLIFRSDNRINIRVTLNALSPSATDVVITSDSCAYDSLYLKTIVVDTTKYMIGYVIYKNFYDTLHIAGEMYIIDCNHSNIGVDDNLLALTLFDDADDSEPGADSSSNGQSHQELFYYTGDFYNDDRYPTDATNTHNINFPGCSPYTICVGATNCRDGFMNYQGKWHANDWGSIGERSGYSGMGPSIEGISKPDVVAPGTYLTSSYSSFYCEKNQSKWDAAYFDYNGRKYAWHNDCGTSVSAPVVTGIIALWLEACPTLTREQIMETLRETSNRTYGGSTEGDNEYGYGQIDAYEGIKYVIKHFTGDGIKEVTTTPEDSSHDGSSLAVYDLTGRKVSRMNRGIYIKGGKKSIK